MARTVAVVGATGLIGGALSRALVDRGDLVLAVSRGGSAGVAGARDVRWDPAQGPPPDQITAGVDAVVNLAGAPIFGSPWTASRRETIRESRVRTTRLLAERLGGEGGARILVNASAVGYYGARHDDAELDESASPGDDFLARVAVAWEDAAQQARQRGARVVLVRTGLVLSADGGILPPLRTLTRLMLGGPLGGGRQWLPWIHIDDEVGALLSALDSGDLDGPLNAVAPEPVRQREFMRTLGEVLDRPAWLPTPAFPLRLALGEMSTLALDGQRAVPAVLQARGYPFAFRNLEPALRAALGRTDAAASG
jgi:uncharacterized protein